MSICKKQKQFTQEFAKLFDNAITTEYEIFISNVFEGEKYNNLCITINAITDKGMTMRLQKWNNVQEMRKQRKERERR